MNKQILLACISALLGTALSGAVKPLAIWNGEFIKNTTPERNGVTLLRKSSSFKTQHIVVPSRVAPAQVSWPKKEHLYSVIANIRNISTPGSPQVIFSYYNGSTDICWILLDREMKMDADYSSNDVNIDSRKAAEPINNPAGMHSYGLMLASSFDNRMSLGFLDGIPVHSNKITSIREDTNYLSIGGKGVASGTNIEGAEITYIALFPENDNLSLEDFKTWSLHEMTRAETATNVTAAAEAEDAVLKGGEGVGINLLGGTYRVEGAKTAHALFVQEDSTIEFADSASLTLAGPLYIAQYRTLTLTLADGAAGASLKARHFADMGQITYDDGKISVGETGSGEVALEKPTLGTVIVDGEEVKPLQVVDGNVVFGVNTKPGLWYAVAASSDIETINGRSLKPTTEAFQATGESAKIEVAFPENATVMFYKVLAATSEDDLKGEGEEE